MWIGWDKLTGQARGTSQSIIMYLCWRDLPCRVTAHAPQDLTSGRKVWATSWLSLKPFLTLMVKGQLRMELMPRTICPIARGFCRSEDPAPLQQAMGANHPLSATKSHYHRGWVTGDRFEQCMLTMPCLRTHTDSFTAVQHGETRQPFLRSIVEPSMSAQHSTAQQGTAVRTCCR